MRPSTKSMHGEGERSTPFPGPHLAGSRGGASAGSTRVGRLAARGIGMDDLPGPFQIGDRLVKLPGVQVRLPAKAEEFGVVRPVLQESARLVDRPPEIPAVNQGP